MTGILFGNEFHVTQKYPDLYLIARQGVRSHVLIMPGSIIDISHPGRVMGSAAIFPE